jgi:hypothetical protein
VQIVQLGADAPCPGDGDAVFKALAEPNMLWRTIVKSGYGSHSLTRTGDGGVQAYLSRSVRP